MKAFRYLSIFAILWLQACSTYSSLEGVTSDGLRITPSPLQRSLAGMEILQNSNTMEVDSVGFWSTGYFSYLGQDSYLWEELLRSEMEQLAKQGLGMDIIELDQSGFEGRGPALKTGWIISDKAQFFVINELAGRSPHTFFLLQTAIKPHWDFVITQSDDAREGFDIQYRRDY